MRHTLTLFMSLFLVGLVAGQVRINELSATHAPRNLRWDENDQPFAGAGPAWWAPEFDDSRWAAGDMPIGHSASGLATSLTSELRDVSPSLYVRERFAVSATEAALDDPVVLTINYDDGFIAWINGVEVARRNMGATKGHIYHDQLSHRASTLGTSNEAITLNVASSLLVEGENVIAIQVNNNTLNGDLRLSFSMRINRPTGSDPSLVSVNDEVVYLPGLGEPTSGLVDPATPAEDPSDWIEIANLGATDVDLSGWALSDDAGNPLKWEFPAGTTLPAGGFLVVLADDPGEPIANAGFLHANFKLSSGGEFLGLYDASGNPVDTLDDEYPRQFPNYSYGRNDVGEWRFFCTPSAGAANQGEEFIAKADAPDFSLKGGFYDAAIAVALTSMTPNVRIRYTTDGTEPTLENGTDYPMLPLSLAPINSRRGHVIRARAFRDGFIPSNIKTHTFLINQDARVRNSPTLIYAGDEERALYDPFGVLAINGGSYPTGLWQSLSATDYNNVINRGRAYERPIHAEFYFPDGTAGFRTDVGLRIAASSFSRPRMRLNQTNASPWPADPNEKPSFNLYFRDEYGNPSVDLPLNGPARSFSRYERFRIRAGKNDIQNPFVIDELFRRLSSDMGNGASLGVINSLYVNGELKGYYNMVERLREPFFRSLHSTDPNAQWDVLQFEGNDNIAEGDKVAWNDMISRLNAPVNESNWERVLEVADIENMVNYYLLNIYAATWDWPHNNWVAAKERSVEGRYRLYVWDAEGAINNSGPRAPSQEMINTFILGTQQGQEGENGTRGELRDLWRGLNRWEEFRLLFADQIQKHLFNGGILDDRDLSNSHIRQRLDGLVDEFEDLLRLIQSQSVDRNAFNRWVNPATGRRRYLLGPNREEFRDNDLWPETAPPVFSQFGGSVAEGQRLVILNEGGLIYYTTDGSDPRLFGGAPNPNAISQVGSLDETEFVAQGSVWKHNATEGDLGTAWRDPTFDDGSWMSGPAPLGYGSISRSSPSVVIPIETQVNRRNGQPTSYFRKSFEVTDASAYVTLNADLLVDGGVIVYLNGIEAFRESNLPDVVTYESAPNPDTSDGDETNYATFALDASLLVEGTNVIAIELHNNPSNSDMVIDVVLRGERLPSENNPLLITEPMTVKARSFENGEWSAVTSADFTVESVPATSENLVIGEILYSPAAPSIAEVEQGYDDANFFEYLRLDNVSTETVDLSGVRFTDGVSFDFAESDRRVLRAGESLLLVRNREAFRFRFGVEFDDLLVDNYQGGLSGNGEQIRLIGSDDVVLHEFAYGIASPWPDLTDLVGHSIRLVDRSGDHNLGSNWAASGTVGGAPGGLESYASWQNVVFTEAERLDPSISGANADPDSDGWSNLFEFAFGTLPGSGASAPSALESGLTEIEGEIYLTVTFLQPAAERAVILSAEGGADLQSWDDAEAVELPSVPEGDGSIRRVFRHLMPVSQGGGFLRLRATAQ